MNLIWIETWNWNLKLKLETETWNRNLKLEHETETWNLNLNLKLETCDWKLKLKLELKLKIETWQTQDQYQLVGKSGLVMSDSVTASG